MAHFKGSIQEFHHYIGPRIKNVINILVKKIRDDLNGKCEHCQEIKELQSAHVHGKGRRSIIEVVLKKYADGEVVHCEIEKVEEEILHAHHPLEDAFKFLCQACHVKYDSQVGSVDDSSSIRIKKERPADSNLEFKKIGRIKLWAERSNQINHKIVSAFINLESKGQVTVSGLKTFCTNSNSGNKFYVTNFDGHLASMKTDHGNSHGKVFYEENGILNIWPYVRKEIEKYWIKPKSN